MHRYIERVVDLLDPALNVLHDLSEDEARARVLSADPIAIRDIDGSFAIVARDGITVRMARSLDRPMRYFLAKRAEGPALFIADRMDTLRSALGAEGLANQFHPSYTRMVPAHHVVELRLVGCPDPDPTYTRFFTPQRAALPADLDVIGQRYIGALAHEVARWLQHVDRVSEATAPIGVCFSGGIDSGSVFLVVYDTIRRLGMSPGSLQGFMLDGDGGDENLKDYPIEENPELTIRSVVDNLMLYQEGWGVGRIKHSLTYSGGLSRSYVRTYAPARSCGFDGFSPLAQPGVLEVAEGIPFAALTNYDVPTLYALKGEIVGRGIRAVTGFDMPAFPKRRFQHGAIEAEAL